MEFADMNTPFYNPDIWAKNIMTDQEINEAVARKLGYEKNSFGAWEPRTVGSIRIHGSNVLPDYCHSIEAAWEVTEKLYPRQAITLNQKLMAPFGWVCNIWSPYSEDPDATAQADTAPMAICLAFLKTEAAA